MVRRYLVTNISFGNSFEDEVESLKSNGLNPSPIFGPWNVSHSKFYFPVLETNESVSEVGERFSQLIGKGYILIELDSGVEVPADEVQRFNSEAAYNRLHVSAKRIPLDLSEAIFHNFRDF